MSPEPLRRCHFVGESSLFSRVQPNISNISEAASAAIKECHYGPNRTRAGRIPRIDRLRNMNAPDKDTTFISGCLCRVQS
jgi:hypothetical protein